MKIIALYSIKGGVGKTTTACNLAHMAAELGHRVLLCDLDPQGAASFYFRIRPHDDFNRKRLMDKKNGIGKYIRGTDYEGLDMLPADLSFRNLDLSLDDCKESRKHLAKVLGGVARDYDLVFIDCPPNITLLSENIFNASDHIMVPLIPSPLSMQSYRMLLDFFSSRELSKRKLMPFFSMVEKRKKLHGETMAEYSNDKRFLKTAIPFSSCVERMGVMRQPVRRFAPRTAGARACQELWEELRERVSGL